MSMLVFAVLRATEAMRLRDEFVSRVSPIAEFTQHAVAPWWRWTVWLKVAVRADALRRQLCEGAPR